jgi:tRNA(Ile)-lysidine synthase
MDIKGQSDAKGPDARGCDWAKLAATLAVRLPIETLHPRVAAALLKIAQSDSVLTIGIACSGGADSLCLLLLLYAHFPELRGRLAVLHFDHHIRGAESASDAAFVSEVAASLSLHCESGFWDAGTPDATEEAARAARMNFLHEKADVIAFGHNRTDVAETILMRLGRGSSLDGLAGPRPVQCFRKRPNVVHLRPLLNLSGAEIREALRDCDIPWREDSTNSGLKYTRNKLRHEVLPALENALGRDWTAGAARSRERIEEADDTLNNEADELLQSAHENKDALHVSLLSNSKPALARRILERWLESTDLRGHIPVQALDRILESALHGSFPKNLNISGLTISGEFISESASDKINPDAQDWSEIGAAQNCEIYFPDRTVLRIEAIDLPPDQIEPTIADLRAKGSLTDVMIAVSQDSVFNIRRRTEGDAYKPLGAPGRNKLHDMQINRKIPASDRPALPIVLVESDIVWSPFLPPADEYKLSSDTLHAVRLTYRNISPASDSYKRNAD